MLSFSDISLSLNSLHPHATCICPLILILLYILYLLKFKFYYYYEKMHFSKTRASLIRGTPPPSYPNGWYRVSESKRLHKNTTQSIKLAGRHIALFRGDDGITYALNAFCTHMGANLAHGGKVKWTRCIECPFHGWAFDGKTGKCVNTSELDSKTVSHHIYNDINCMTKKEGEYIKKELEKSESKIEVYQVREVNGMIYVWFHALGIAPTYELPSLPKLDTVVQERCDSLEYINCHIQEIPENGADWAHFKYVHRDFVSKYIWFIKFKWAPTSRRPNEADFDKVMRHHKIDYVRNFQNNLYNDMLADGRMKNITNVISLDAYLEFFGRWDMYLQTATVFQVGPTNVYLFIKFRFFEIVLLMSEVPVYKFTVALYHKMYSSWWMPYWLSAFLLRFYLVQVGSDKFVWNNKVFKKEIHYNLKTEADAALLKWREWYSQYYDGCHEFEKKNESLDW